MKTKLTLINNHEDWDINRRYKVGASVRYNSADWQNTTGVNSEPGTDDNWIQTSIVDPRPYRVYTALITQSGTNNPTVVVQENTLGFDIVFTRTGSGFYQTQNLGTTQDKLYMYLRSSIPLSQENTIYFLSNKIVVQTYNLSTSHSISSVDDKLNKTPIEIRIYN
jgi:hypothetical protein